MLVQFKVANFRSFAEPQILSLEAITAKKEYLENIATANKQKLKLLKGAVLYGANASGKSNFLRAMGVMSNIVLYSFAEDSLKGYDPFLLNEDLQKQPSSFEVIFIQSGISYRYGFEITENAIVAEWLYQTKIKKEEVLFIRNKDTIKVFPSFVEGAGLETKTKENKLFLSVVEKFNGPISQAIYSWFKQFNVIDGINHKPYRGLTFSMLEDEKMQPVLLSFYQKLDLGFEDIEVKKEAFDLDKISTNLPEEIFKNLLVDFQGKTMYSLIVYHKLQQSKESTDKNQTQQVSFDARQKESLGTNKIIDLSGVIFHTLQNGGVLVIDELDAKLHPLITMSIIRLFQDSDINPNNAQLIFATHDTNILRFGRFRRDQIYFVDKNNDGASQIYSLVEYDVRNDKIYEKDYINGSFGAIPKLKTNTEIKKLMQVWQEKF